MRFTGSYEEIRALFKDYENQGAWREVNNNHKQFRHECGAVFNWVPSTGGITFQGREEVRGQLEKIAQSLIEDGAESSPISMSDQEDAERVWADDQEILGDRYSDSELVIALVGPVGSQMGVVSDAIQEKLRLYNYDPQEIRISRDVIRELTDTEIDFEGDEFKRISHYMDVGNELRKRHGDSSILALGVAAKVNQQREEIEGELAPLRRKAFIISSLKNEREVERLREIYTNGLFVIGVHCDEKRRHKHLTDDLGIENADATRLMNRDHDESTGHGQHTSRTFHLADFFIHDDGNGDKLNNDIHRILKLIFGHPYITPTFDEFAMFMAFSSALRSADLSRQVGAIIAKDDVIVSTGANDVPMAGGGLYWPERDGDGEVKDREGGRDYMRGFDQNTNQTAVIIQQIIDEFPADDREGARKILEDSNLKHITEYGRVVHAEMEAILACARSNISTSGATLYSTTFPCHNCAKHIVAAGIDRVVYVEPYAKSKAIEFHTDSILNLPAGQDCNEMVAFEPFVGVGPRSFFNLFSINTGAGYPVVRKDRTGQVVKWEQKTAKLRLQMLPASYLEREALAARLLEEYLERPYAE
jgi:deoxycytidylate deaminase